MTVETAAPVTAPLETVTPIATPRTLQRLWTRVDATAGRFGCWPWRGGVNAYGYPRMSIDGGYVLLHRLVLSLELGRSLEPGEEGLHSCDNPRCLNPSHLRAGSQADNMRDMADRGRSTRGTRNPNARLNDADVLAIRKAATGARGEHARIARQFGVSRSTVQLILSGARWGHIQEAAS